MIKRSDPEPPPVEQPLGKYFSALFYRGHVRLIRLPERTTVVAMDPPQPEMKAFQAGDRDVLKSWVMARMAPAIMHDARERHLSIEEVMGGE